MKERRQFERFMFPIPVRIETMMTGRKKVLDLVTRDISVSGTFFPTLTLFHKEHGLFLISPFQLQP